MTKNEGNLGEKYSVIARLFATTTTTAANKKDKAASAAHITPIRAYMCLLCNGLGWFGRSPSRGTCRVGGVWEGEGAWALQGAAERAISICGLSCG